MGSHKNTSTNKQKCKGSQRFFEKVWTFFFFFPALKPFRSLILISFSSLLALMGMRPGGDIDSLDGGLLMEQVGSMTLVSTWKKPPLYMWWFQMFVYFYRHLGKGSKFDSHFSNRLKPPPSLLLNKLEFLGYQKYLVLSKSLKPTKTCIPPPPNFFATML